MYVQMTREEVKQWPYPCYRRQDWDDSTDVICCPQGCYVRERPCDDRVSMKSLRDLCCQMAYGSDGDSLGKRLIKDDNAFRWYNGNGRGPIEDCHRVVDDARPCRCKAVSSLLERYTMNFV